MRALIIAVLMLASRTSRAGVSDWSLTDSALQTAFAVTLAADYVQTKAIVANSFELNPIIGQHGERVSPDVYFPAALVVHTAAMLALPKRWRRVAQSMSIAVQTRQVLHNRDIGYTFSYSIDFL